ncbi:MAG: hypothetical protein C0497_06970 [Gemmatimonas sp.]|nr:hypothetical protein [Gemmatimonas sp.]
MHLRNGFAYDSSRTNSRFVFTRASGRLAFHPVTDGRSPSERVDRVVAFTGQAFRVDAPGQTLMTLERGATVLEPRVASPWG